MTDEQKESQLRKMFDSLAEREREIFEQRFGIDLSNPDSLRKLAETFENEKQRIAQIERKTREKLDFGDDDPDDAA